MNIKLKVSPLLEMPNPYLSKFKRNFCFDKLYNDKIIENTIYESFELPVFNNDNILDYHPDEIFIDANMVQNSFKLNKPYDLIIPTVKFHFEKSPTEINFKELQGLLGDDVIILNVELGSTFLIIAFLMDKEFNSEQNLKKSIVEVVKTKFNNLLEPIKNKLNSSLGKHIIGNFINDPETRIPNDQDITNIYKKKSVNILQNTHDLDQIELEYIKNEVYLNFKNEKLLKK